MVNARVFDEYIHFELMYITDPIFPVLTIKHLVNKYVKTTIPHKLATGKNLQYQTYVFYYVHMLYKRQLHTFTQRH